MLVHGKLEFLEFLIFNWIGLVQYFSCKNVWRESKNVLDWGCINSY